MSRRGLVRACVLVSACAAAACSGGAETVDQTIATVEPVRPAVTIGAEASLPVARVAPGGTVATSGAGLARLELDGGAKLLLGGSGRLVVRDAAEVELPGATGGGRLFASTEGGDRLRIRTDRVTLGTSDGALSVELAAGGATVYVVRGEVGFTAGATGGVVRAGEQLVVDARSARVEPALVWNDWTGGLARPGPGDDAGPAGMGSLEARLPGQVGTARQPLVVRSLDVRVEVRGDLAVTEVDQVFHNPGDQTVEGLYRFRTPDGAALQRFAIDRDGQLVEAYVRERAQAAASYEAQVFQGSTEDPALLEWDAPGAFQARIYPIGPGQRRRIVVRYAEWLARPAASAVRLYRYPMGQGGRPPYVEAFSLTVDLEDAGAGQIRAGMGATVEGPTVRLRKVDFRPRADFWLELGDDEPAALVAYRSRHTAPRRAPDAPAPVGETEETDYLLVPLVLPMDLAADAERGPGGLDLVVVADVSAATDPSHLELGQGVVEALASHLGPDDRLAVLASDLALRAVVEEEGGDRLGPASAERVERLLTGLARIPAGGASDLGTAITAAGDLLDPGRRGAVVYVGDGAPTVGELQTPDLLERIARLPAQARLYAVAVGASANLDLLAALCRGRGLATRAEERRAAAEAALRFLAHLSRPVARQVTVNLGPGIESVYPAGPTDVALGDVLHVIGRVSGSVPSSVRITGTAGGRRFDQDVPIEVETIDDSSDLRLRWAGERLRALLLEGVPRETIVELGTRYGLITPFTSFYVPSASELRRTGISGLLRYELLELEGAPRRADRLVEGALAALLPAPLALAGCGSSEDQEAPSPAPAASPSVAAQSPLALAEEALSEAAPPSVTEPVEPGAAASTPVDMPAPGDAVAAAPEPPPPPAQAQAAADTAAAGAPVFEGGAPSRSARISAPPPGESRVRRAETAARRAAVTRWSGDREEAPAPRDVALDGVIGRDVDGRQGPARPEPVEAERLQTGPAAEPEAPPDAHRTAACSSAASLPLGDRRALWRERLERGQSAQAWAVVYRRALRDCEAGSWRERRALLDLIIDRAGTVSAMVEVYRVLASSGAGPYLRQAILGRVRAPADLVPVRSAMSGADVEWQLVEAQLAGAATADARLALLRDLVARYPGSADLKLRLLAALERAGRLPEALRLARQLRADRLSDAEVRTSLGELLLRHGQEAEARRVFSEMVEFAPYDALARRRLGDLYRAHGWFDDAYRQYQTLAEIRPDDLTVQLLLASAAAGAGRVDEALRLERSLAESPEPDATGGLARVAVFASSARLAKLRLAAREAHDQDQLRALTARMRRSAVLRSAGALRATLLWAHPHAGLSLWSAHPNLELSRPADVWPELGIEAFDVANQEDGTYRIEVRREALDLSTPVEAELVLVWNEGQGDELILVVPLRFEGEVRALAWTITGRQLAEAVRPEEVL